MKKTYLKKIPPEDFKELLVRRSRGEKLPDLSNRFYLHHTTIMHHCRRFGVEVGIELTREQHKLIDDFLKGVNKRPKFFKYAGMIEEERICKGFSYSEYVRRGEELTRRKLLQQAQEGVRKMKEAIHRATS